MIAGLRRHRVVVVIALVVLGGALAAAVLTAQQTGPRGYLDPENPLPDGARAVAEVLADRGVEVDVVRRAADLETSRPGRDTTVMVTSSDQLGEETARSLRQHLGFAAVLVLAEPAPVLQRAMDLPIERHGGALGPVEAGCADPLLGDLSLEVPPTEGYRTTGGRASATCFDVGGEPAGALVVRLDRATTTYVVAAADLFANGTVTESDNAAAALRLLGGGDRLVWYVPDVRDVAPGQAGSLQAQLPPWLMPALVLLALSSVPLLLWRGRRLGPLVVEPLPVVVKAVESTQGRGRLYRKVGDPTHAAGVLRRATFRRLAERVRLPADTDLDTLALAVARTTGVPPERIRSLLSPGPVLDDAALTALATDLTALEQEITHP